MGGKGVGEGSGRCEVTFFGDRVEGDRRSFFLICYASCVFDFWVGYFDGFGCGRSGGEEGDADDSGWGVAGS